MRRRHTHRPWIAALALCATVCACAPAAVAPRPVLTATGVVSAFEGKTVYQGATASGGTISFALPKGYVRAYSNTGEVWVRARSVNDTTPWTPASPVPTPGLLADGWIRLGAGESAVWGSDPYVNKSGADLVIGIDYWFVYLGDLVVLGH